MRGLLEDILGRKYLRGTIDVMTEVVYLHLPYMLLSPSAKLAMELSCGWVG